MNVYEVVTEELVKLIESSDNLETKGGMLLTRMPTNFITKKPYQGVNFSLLHIFAMIKEFSSPFYLTYNQAKKLGGQVIKGSKSFPVVYYNMLYKDQNGKKISPDRVKAMTRAELDKCECIPFARYSRVFNLDQIEGVSIDSITSDISEDDDIMSCEMVVSSYTDCPEIKNLYDDRAFYRPSEDFINMPKKSACSGLDDYYSILFHEMIHSTGHQSRLNRETVTKNLVHASDAKAVYSQEELVAELGSAMLATITGINSERLKINNAAYLKGYLTDLKNDCKFIFRASKEAQNAVKYMLGR